MDRKRLKTPHKTRCFTLMRHPKGILVAGKLAKRSCVVRVTSGRFVGRCSCGSAATDPWDSCRHQNAVRNYFMDYCFRRKESGVA